VRCHPVPAPPTSAAAKKVRSLRKKAERIAKTEEQAASGRPLNEEQKLLVSTKDAVLKALAESSSLLAMIEDVARAEDARRTQEPQPGTQGQVSVDYQPCFVVEVTVGVQ
jgi:hypothetical protein